MKTDRNIWTHALCGYLLILGLVGQVHGELDPGRLFGGLPPEDYLKGILQPSRHPGLFERVPPEKASGRDIWLRKDTLQAFLAMSQDAAKQGLNLWVVSGFRSFEDQKRIWENKYVNVYGKSIPDPRDRVLKILEYSSMPGTSRHHWGTDLDLNSVDPAWWLSVEGKRYDAWLIRNAARFGFIQAYTSGRKSGYQEEKWHFSFKPTAVPLLATYLDTLTSKNLKGFKGAEQAESVRIFEDYIMSIHPDLRK